MKMRSTISVNISQYQMWIRIYLLAFQDNNSGRVVVFKYSKNGVFLCTEIVYEDGMEIIKGQTWHQPVNPCIFVIKHLA